MKRLQLQRLLPAALLAGFGCALFMTSSLCGILSQSGMLPMDLYWLYFGAIPGQWGMPFHVLKYMFTLVPMTLIAYFVSNDIQTNLIEPKYAVVLRYQSTGRWVRSGCQTALAVTALFLLAFHASFFAANHILSSAYGDCRESVFSAGETGSVFVLIAKQIFFLSALSILQMLVALRHTIQRGMVVGLCTGGTVIFLDLLPISARKLFAADLGITSLLFDIALFLLALPFLGLPSSGKAKENYLT